MLYQGSRWREVGPASRDTASLGVWVEQCGVWAKKEVVRQGKKDGEVKLGRGPRQSRALGHLKQTVSRQ